MGMSGKAGRITNRNLSVVKTLDEVIRVFDDVPIINDLVTEFWLASYAVRASLFHYALELGMKCLSSYGKHKHDLLEIYDEWPDSKRESRELLDGAFKDAVSFYGIHLDRKEWKHLRDFRSYLSETGDGGLFQKLRYWPLDGKSDLLERPSPLPDLLISREMVRFISDVVRGNGKVGEGVFVSKLVDIKIQTSFNQKRYADNGNSRRLNKEREALEEDNRILLQWASQHGSLLLAIKYAYEHNFDVLNDWGNTVLSSVYSALKETNDYRIRPALDYTFSTFGAKTSDCEAISSAQVERVGRRGTVISPSDNILGFIIERHDGLWMAEDPGTSYSQLAFGSDDAVGLVIENGTEIVSVALNGGTPREARVLFPNPLDLYLREEVLCDFWDAEHGIVSGDEIIISETGQVVTLPDPAIHGIVKSVNNHMVTISKTR